MQVCQTKERVFNLVKTTDHCGSRPKGKTDSLKIANKLICTSMSIFIYFFKSETLCDSLKDDFF